MTTFINLIYKINNAFWLKKVKVPNWEKNALNMNIYGRDEIKYLSVNLLDYWNLPLIHKCFKSYPTSFKRRK